MSSPAAGFGHAFGHQLHLQRNSLVQSWPKIRAIGLIVAVGVLLEIGVQAIYPRSYTTPLLRMQGITVGVQTKASVARRLGALEQGKFTVRAASKTYQPTYAEAGLLVDEAATAQHVLGYSWRERLIPFSLFRRDSKAAVVVQPDEMRLKAWAETFARENTKAPTNASVDKQATDYKVNPSVDGTAYDVTKIVHELRQVVVTPGLSVAMSGQAVPPAVKTEVIQTAVEQLKQQTHKPLELTIEGAATTISPEELHKLTNINTDPASGKVQITYDRVAFKDRLVAAANQGTGTPAGVSLDDGVSQMISALTQGQKTDIRLSPIIITTPVRRSYSPTNSGMLALIQDWQRDTGLDTGVYFKELGSPHRQAEYRSNVKFVSASTYKAYVAYYVFTSIDQGKISFDETLGMDRNVRACFVEMIVISTNYCAGGFGGALGWQNINNFAHQGGFTDTWVEPNNMSTTPANLAALLERLNNGTLIGPDTSAYFLSLLRRQMHRNGIPAGVPGIAVADKVGFLNGSWQDAAIVYHPKGTYLLVVMTRGGGTYQTADLSRRVNQFVSQ
jgi:beta-lactamase class A